MKKDRMDKMDGMDKMDFELSTLELSNFRTSPPT